MLPNCTSPWLLGLCLTICCLSHGAFGHPRYSQSKSLARLFLALSPSESFGDGARASAGVANSDRITNRHVSSYMKIRNSTPSSPASLFGLRFNLLPEDLSEGRTVIPTLVSTWNERGDFVARRNQMFAEGLYPGVDYTIEEVLANKSLKVRPDYPLIKRLERSDWPVIVPIELAPRWMSPAAYNAMTAAFAASLASATLATFFFLSALVTTAYIPSESMTPTVQPGDLLVIEKISPRLKLPFASGDMLTFEPTEELRQIKEKREAQASAAVIFPPNHELHGPSRFPAKAAVQLFLSKFQQQETFLKRIVAGPGDRVEVSRSGSVNVNGVEVKSGAKANKLLDELLSPGSYVVPPNAYFVLGDNSLVSIDSRCWGPLPAQNVKGRPLFRLLPISRFGPIE